MLGPWAGPQALRKEEVWRPGAGQNKPCGKAPGALAGWSAVAALCEGDARTFLVHGGCQDLFSQVAPCPGRTATPLHLGPSLTPCPEGLGCQGVLHPEQRVAQSSSSQSCRRQGVGLRVPCRRQVADGKGLYV